MALDRVPDMNVRSSEIEDVRLLVDRLLYRQGRMWELLLPDDYQSRADRDYYLRAALDSNRADLHRLEELAAALPAQREPRAA
jgi:hypothetical protein